MDGGFQKQKHLKNSHDVKKSIFDKEWQHDSLPEGPFPDQVRALVSLPEARSGGRSLSATLPQQSPAQFVTIGRTFFIQ
ncbi:hypothetical protein ACET76_11140 [Aeromonas caviae]|uniref:hypothetical protein n=1 Tax=Aeromonas TaxID=642 RepID=UPI0029D72C94|nr:hypothetical protein [Aeromonas caviae]MDX7843881.1 hypothetical protein [Aeromonas caviae]